MKLAEQQPAENSTSDRISKIFMDHFRPKRMRQFVETFGLRSSDQILDVGGAIDRDGNPLNWSYITVEPKVTIGNINGEDRDAGRFSYRRLDGTNLPYKDSSFDIVFSNSVIEHVGNWEKQMKFAKEIRRVAQSYYVQTPNKWFFVEPHFVAPFIHYLPRPIYRKLIPFFSLWYWVTRPTSEKVDTVLGRIELLNEAQMQELFPDAFFIKEKFMFFTKSIIAVRRL